MRDKEELFEAEYSTSRRRTRKSGEGASRDSKPGVSTDPDLKPVEVMPHQARAQIKRNLASQNVGYEGVPAKKAIRKSIERHKRKKRVVESIYNAYCDLGSLISEMGPDAREYKKARREIQTNPRPDSVDREVASRLRIQGSDERNQQRYKAATRSKNKGPVSSYQNPTRSDRKVIRNLQNIWRGPSNQSSQEMLRTLKKRGHIKEGSAHDAYLNLNYLINEMGPEAREYKKARREAQKGVMPKGSETNPIDREMAARLSIKGSDKRNQERYKAGIDNLNKIKRGFNYTNPNRAERKHDRHQADVWRGPSNKSSQEMLQSLKKRGVLNVESVYNTYCALGSLISEMGPEAREYRRYQRMAQRQAGTNQIPQAEKNFKRAEKVYDRIPRKWSREMARSKQALERLPKDAKKLKPAGSPSGRRERRFDRDVAHLADDPKNVKPDFKNN